VALVQTWKRRHEGIVHGARLISMLVVDADIPRPHPPCFEIEHTFQFYDRSWHRKHCAVPAALDRVTVLKSCGKVCRGILRPFWPPSSHSRF
jgi:hypothetical protein